MGIGNVVITLVDKMANDGLKKIIIPKGTRGLVCEVYDDFALVEIWESTAPEGVEGVFGFDLNEIKEAEN